MIAEVLNLFSSVAVARPSSGELATRGFRLDASFYDLQKSHAEDWLKSSPQSRPLGELADCYCSNIRYRNVVSPQFGLPLLTGKDLDIVNDDGLSYFSKVLSQNIQHEVLRENDVLISSAGTIGKLDFVRKNHEGRYADQHIIRIRPHPNGIDAGYIYALLATPLVQAIVTHQSAGAVIQMLSVGEIRTIPVPRLKGETAIGDRIRGAFDARAASKQLLAEADQATHEFHKLPALSEQQAEWLDRERKVESVMVSAWEVALANGDGAEYRLDAHFYNPLARLAIKNLKKCGTTLKTVGQLTERVFTCTRFARTYVDKPHGVPFLSGKNIIQVRPQDLKFVSRSETEQLLELRLQTGWTLVTRSGTLGRTCFVWENYENYTGSEHLLRVVPNESEIDPGYLYAFLSSRYGYEQILRFRHGSVIDELTDEQLKCVLVPVPAPNKQKLIGDKVRAAYEKRAEAIRLEDEAQEILMNELHKTQAKKGA